MTRSALPWISRATVVLCVIIVGFMGYMAISLLWSSVLSVPAPTSTRTAAAPPPDMSTDGESDSSASSNVVSRSSNDEDSTNALVNTSGEDHDESRSHNQSPEGLEAGLDLPLEVRTPHLDLLAQDWAGVNLITSEFKLPDDWESDPELDAEVISLLQQHNNNQRQLALVTLQGKSNWQGFSKYDFPLTVEYDREGQRASMAIYRPEWQETERVNIDRKYIQAYDGGAWGVAELNTFYLLMFKEYDPREFKTSENSVMIRSTASESDQEIDVSVMSSSGRTLRFSSETGYLLQAEYDTPQGVILVDFYDHFKLEGPGGATLPGTTKVKLPNRLLPSEASGLNHMEFAIDPDQVLIQY